MNLSIKVNLIRKIALFLFIFSLASLLGSLWLQNSIVNFKFQKVLIHKDSKLENISGSLFKDSIICSEKLNDCKKNKSLNLLKYTNNFGDCFLKDYKFYYIVEDEVLDKQRYLFIGNDLTNGIKPKYINKKVELNVKVLENNKNCIRNSKFYFVYKIFPIHKIFYNLKINPNTKLGANYPINPFLNGEVSISNVVKRFPINYVFKPLLYISVVLMFFYWINYNRLFDEILKKKNELFVFFGIGSAVFLFFHVLFLGMEIDNKIFKLIRKLIILLFILSEVIAQTLLSVKLLKYKQALSNFCNINVIYLKILFVIIVALISLFVIVILIFYNLSSKVDYILEWNYFAALLFYYFLSFLMWKKISNL